MTIFQAFVLGLVQGITEFLPISSSGFLILVPDWFEWKLQDLSFDASIHLATLGGVIVALFPEIKRIVFSDKRLLTRILIATIPVLIAGFLLEIVFGFDLRSKEIVATSFIVWGIVLLVADNFAKKIKDDIKNVGWKRALAIGCVQTIALIPGTSRSGITITAGLFSGLSRSTAIIFSFLLSIPAIAIAGSVSLFQFINQPGKINWPVLSVGVVTAFVTSLLTIKILRAWISGRGTFAVFAIFRVVVGILLLL